MTGLGQVFESLWSSRGLALQPARHSGERVPGGSAEVSLAKPCETGGSGFTHGPARVHFRPSALIDSKFSFMCRPSNPGPGTLGSRSLRHFAIALAMNCSTGKGHVGLTGTIVNTRRLQNAGLTVRSAFLLPSAQWPDACGGRQAQSELWSAIPTNRPFYLYVYGNIHVCKHTVCVYMYIFIFIFLFIYLYAHRKHP